MGNLVMLKVEHEMAHGLIRRDSVKALLDLATAQQAEIARLAEDNLALTAQVAEFESAVPPVAMPAIFGEAS